MALTSLASAKLRLSAVGLAALSLLLSACSEKKVAAPVSSAVPVSVANAEQRTVPVEVRAIGNVEPLATVQVKSRIAGQVERVSFTQGQDVREGQLLFSLDTRQLQADLARAESNLARDQAQYLNARAQAERADKLFNEGILAREQYDALKANAAALEAAVEAGKAALENARVQLAYTRITAPISGRTGSLVVNAGNVVRANEDPAMVTINQITPTYVSFAVPEQMLPAVKRRMDRGALKVQAVVKGEEDRPIDGKLTFIDNTVDVTTGTIKLKATFANSDRRLWPGQFVDAVLTLSNIPNATVVPSTAVQSGQQGNYVYLVKQDMTAEPRNVVTSRTVNGMAVIEQGLQPGDRVVTEGIMRITPGAKLEIKQGTSNAEAKAPVAAPRT